MGIKKFFATKDNTITNAFKGQTLTRATGSNVGAADALEVYKLYDRIETAGTELSRILIQFDIDDIASKRASGEIPGSGSVDFFLNLYNARHPFTVPESITLLVQPLSRSWDEGRGVDLDTYTDTGVSNWISASSVQAWGSAGGDYVSGYDKILSLTTGLEDLSVDITNIVEDTLNSALDNYGFGIRLSGTLETDEQNYYTKKFFARTSQFFFKRPTIEARWDSSIKDQRGDFYVSSSMLSTENLHTIYLYNNFRGNPTNIPAIGTGSIYVKLFDAEAGGVELSSSVSVSYPITGGFVDTGLYSCSFDLDTTASTVYDRWYDSTLSTCFYTGTINLKSYGAQEDNKQEPLILTITNLKENYSKKEKNTRIRLYTRKRNWSPTIYTVAKTEIENYFVNNIYYKVVKKVDNEEVISYGTGSSSHTLLSYDKQGSYFDFDFSLLEAGTGYDFKFIIKEGTNYNEYPTSFTFRVEE
jgi:hypothetical protein